MDFEFIISSLENETTEQKENLIFDVCNSLLNILYKKEYSSEDKKIIQEFVTSGMYEKSIKEGIKNSRIRNILKNIDFYYGNELKQKSPEFNDFYTKENMFKIMEEVYSEILSDNNKVQNLDIDTHARVLEYFISCIVECGLGNTFDLVNLYKKRISLDEFKKSSVFNAISLGLRITNIEGDSDYKREKLKNYYNFAQIYIFDCRAADIDIDFENDKFLREFSNEQIYSLKGFATLVDIDKYKSSDLTEMFNQVNAHVSNLLKRAFETLDYKLNLEDKYALNNYFSSSFKFFKNSIKKYQNLDKIYVDEIFEYLYKIERYSLNYDGDTRFIKDIYDKDLIYDYKSLSKMAIKNSNYSQILVLWKANIDSTVIERYLESLKNAGENPYKSEVMKRYVEELIENIAVKKAFNYLDGFDFNLIKEYLDNITKRDDFNIFDEQYVCDILQLIYTNRFPYNMETELKQILEKRCHISKINIDLEKEYLLKFINNPQNQVVTDEDKMEDFVKHLGNLKLANYRILNQSLIDFVLKQSIIKNSAISNNPEKYKGLIERCLEDLGRNDLAAKINQKNYVYFIRDFISKDLDTVGKNYYKSRIYLKQSLVNDLLYHGSYEALETIFHENKHSLQDYDIDHSDYTNYYKYLMTKEKIIRDCDPEFYDMNYELMFTEIDARISEVTKMIDFLKRIEPIDTMQLVINDLKNIVLSKANKRIANEYQNLQKGKLKRKTQKSDELFRVEDLFDEIILKHHSYIHNYPKLKIEYNEDGTLKRINQILADIDSIFDTDMFALFYDDTTAKKISNDYMDVGLFYVKMLKNGNCFKPKNLPEDLRAIMNYEIQHKDTVYITAILIYQNIPRLLEQFDEIPKEKMQSLHSEINTILQRIEKIREKPKEELTYSEIAIFKGFTKINRKFSKNALTMLHETQEKIETLGIDVEPVSVKNSDNLNTKETTPPADIKGQNSANILAKSFYITTEEDRARLIRELITLGYKSQSPIESKSSDKSEQDKSFR